jgi:hypothetical protein
LESILRKGTNAVLGLLAEGDNQRLLGEDGDTLKVVILVDANSIMEHNSNSCHNTNPTIVIIFWSCWGKTSSTFKWSNEKAFVPSKLPCNFVPKGVSQFI